jgi:hypothetical protein
VVSSFDERMNITSVGKKCTKIFGPKKDEARAKLRILHSEDLCDLYRSLGIVRILKSRRLRWDRYAARIEGIKNEHIVSVKIFFAKVHLEE